MAKALLLGTLVFSGGVLSGCPMTVCHEDLLNCRGQCDADDGVACTNLGVAHENGAGVVTDFARAADFYRRGCDKGDVLGCTYLASLYEDGKGVPKDSTRAVTLYKRGCNDGIKFACHGVTRLSQ